MSAKSWCEEFYPTPAKHEENTASDVTAIEHSLKKWTGCLPENLEKHNLSWMGMPFDNELGEKVLLMGAYTCALCERYGITDDYDCQYTALDIPCPIVRMTGRNCDTIPGAGEVSLWQAALSKPAVMVNVLTKLKEFVKNETL